MLLKSVVSVKNTLTGPGPCPAPGVDLALHHVLLLLLLLAASAASDCLLLPAQLWSLS